MTNTPHPVPHPLQQHVAALNEQLSSANSALDAAGSDLIALQRASSDATLRLQREMAALTVSPLSQSQGDGERLLKRVEQRARAAGLDSIFVLTTRTMHWFLKRGFTQVDPDWLPEARKRKYNWDRRSQVLVKKFN